MSTELILTLAITVGALVLFLFQWITADLTALLCLVLLCVFGLISPSEALLGFSNPATITVLCMFVLSEAISRTGYLSGLGDKVREFSAGKMWVFVLFLSIITGVASMFINNTAVVALLIPVALKVSQSSGWALSHLLIPVSFGSMVGGVCTLMGTSTNLLGNSIIKDHGLEAFTVFGFFEMGLPFFLIGVLYIAIFTPLLIPKRRAGKERLELYSPGVYLTHVKVLEGSSFVGRKSDSLSDERSEDFEIIHKVSSKDRNSPFILENDVLYVKADIKALKVFAASNNLEVLPSLNLKEDVEEEEGSKRSIVEAVVAPDSALVDTCISRVELFKRFGLKILALRHHSKIHQYRIDRVRISAGDSFLLAVPEESMAELSSSELFLLLNRPKAASLSRRKAVLSLAILAFVVLSAGLGLLEIHVAALTGVAMLALFSIVSLEDAYKAVNWKVIFLLSGLLALGHAFEHNGGTSLVANSLIAEVERFGPKAVVATYFILTILLTSVLSNNAAIVMMAPLAIETASHLDSLDPRNLVLLVMFASSLCFLTPIGYQTNLMIFGVGNYRFMDFAKIGAPLTLLFLLLSLYLFA